MIKTFRHKGLKAFFEKGSLAGIQAPHAPRLAAMLRRLMALRIEAWLGVARGGEARLWLAEQSAYDMWQAAQKFKAAPMRVQRAPMTA